MQAMRQHGVSFEASATVCIRAVQRWPDQSEASAFMSGHVVQAGADAKDAIDFDMIKKHLVAMYDSYKLEE